MTKETKAKSVSVFDPDITLQNKGDLVGISSSNGGKPSPMKGFDPQFQDIVNYIVKVTHEIWEERAIGKLYDYYGTNIRLHTSSGEIFSRDTVIEATLHALNAFPNRKLFVEEVIWSGNDADDYFSSHRLRHEGNNWGHAAYGDPTGRRAIADCSLQDC